MNNHIFRSSLGGFHRQDVIDYIEKVQKESADEIASLEEQLDAAAEREQQASEQLERFEEENEGLKIQLEELQGRYEQEQGAAAEAAAGLAAAKDEITELQTRIQVLLEENRNLQSTAEALTAEAETVRRDKEQVAQLELEARRRASEVVCAGEKQAEESVRAAEEKAAERLDLARNQAETMAADAEARAKAVLEAAEQRAQERLTEVEVRIAETAQQCNELAASFSNIANHVMTELRRMDVTASQLPISFNHLKGSLQEILEKAQER